MGHGIIPHHHHHHGNSHDDSHHQVLPHHLDHETDSDGLNHLFSNIIHPEDGLKFLTNQNFTSFISKQIVSIATILPVDFTFCTVDLPPLFDRPPADHPNSYSFFYSCTSGLRAPPVF